MALQRTLVLIKPDGVRKGLVGEVIGRFERLGLRMVAMQLMAIDQALAARHYGEHKGKDFYRPLIDFITSGDVVAMVLEGEAAISVVRKLMGPTDPAEAPPGTIRGDFAVSIDHNIVHGSDGPDSAKREIGIFFPNLPPE
ncbi:MAG: nucleoside-diphosphate kinase [Candidatus Solincola sediminis]|uniref:Nucleoside diphosphate kinase n=1 Tax=Candidatus Solincola sediminis TaxID=1797199 RepID=A0A1F2WPX3_9ACTN|nr:MAG: nucleoside-diphosphate kinase [Candidatus Solincola sediminis]OFW58922.1 MAG: nucleoside-diphosphate kinase [Candidatus Solincola sediminis]